MRAFLRLRFFIIVQAHAEFLSDIPTAALLFFHGVDFYLSTHSKSPIYKNGVLD